MYQTKIRTKGAMQIWICGASFLLPSPFLRRRLLVRVEFPGHDSGMVPDFDFSPFLAGSGVFVSPVREEKAVSLSGESHRAVTVQDIHRYHVPCFRQEPLHACQVMPLQNRLPLSGFSSGKPLADRIIPLFDKGGPVIRTEPLPAKAGRFGMLLKQPKACTLKVIFFPLLLNLSQSYQIYSSPVDLDSEYTL